MPAQSYPRVETICLEGYIDLHATLQLTRSVCGTAEANAPALFTIDCSKVRGFSGCALVGIARLRREMRSRGCELELVHCNPQVRAKVIGTLFETLVEEVSPIIDAVDAVKNSDEPIYEKDMETLGLVRDEEVPVYLRNVGIQWYWLN